MGLQSNRLIVRLRGVGRSLGLNPLIARIFGDKSYEARFDKAFLAEIRPGDCVWDIGANRGLYTESIAERVGSTGAVVAFEPSPKNFSALLARCGARANCLLLQMALGDAEGMADLALGSDDLGATSRIKSDSEALLATQTPKSTIQVPIRTGASLVASGTAPAPSVVKIDVEGHELDCICGLSTLLNPEGIRVLGIEVHFGLLSTRGEPDAPRRLESILRAAGYQVRWVDASHIVAVRKE